MMHPRKLEKYMKGVANAIRIEILNYIKQHKDASVSNLAEALKHDYKVIAQHTQKLENAGLINKAYRGQNVVHKLSPYGEKIHKFLVTF